MLALDESRSLEILQSRHFFLARYSICCTLYTVELVFVELIFGGNLQMGLQIAFLRNNRENAFSTLSNSLVSDLKKAAI